LHLCEQIFGACLASRPRLDYAPDVVEMTAEAEQLQFDGIKSDANVKKGIWAQLKEYKKDSDATGGLVIRGQVMAMLGISSPRTSALIREGRFEIYKHFGKEMFGADEIYEYCRIAKISGKGGVAQKRAWDATKAEMKKDVRKAKAIIGNVKKKLQTSTTSR